MNFEDGAYDWIDVKEFGTTPLDIEPRVALAALLEHERFRDSYATADSHEIDSVDLHGPYWLKSLSSDLYEPVGVGEVDGALRAFTMLFSTEDEVVPRMANYERAVVPLLAGATDCFRLRQLPEAAQHEFGWVLDDFTELVTLDRGSGRLLLIVAAAD